MEFRTGDSLFAAIINQQARRGNGIRDLDPTHAYNEGPCNVTIGSGQDAIELNVASGTPQIDGEPFAFSSTLVPLADNVTDEWRQDIVYIAESGDVTSLQGELGENRGVRAKTDANGNFVEDGDGNPVLEFYWPEGPQMTAPEPDDTHQLAGVILARVTVPPEASNSQDLIDDVNGRAVQDLRIPAVRERREPWQLPNVNLSATEFEPSGQASDSRRTWSTRVQPGEVFKLFSFSQNHASLAWNSGWNVAVELRHDAGGIGSGGSTTVFSDTAGYLRGDPIETVEVPLVGDPLTVGLVQVNNGDEQFIGSDKIGLTASYRIDQL